MQIHELVNTPDQDRDHAWEQNFLLALPMSKINIISSDPQQGPDGLPYLLAQTSEQATEPAIKVLDWLSTKGIGLVINPEKSYPDFVLSWGMIWNFKERQGFDTAQSDVPVGTVEISENQKLLAGAPSPDYLPDYVRGIMRDFFRDQGFYQIKILVMSTDKKHFDLAFSLDSLRNPAKEEHQGIAEAISWFLPPHYSVMLVNEAGLPAFVDL